MMILMVLPHLRRFDAGRNTEENPGSHGSRKRVARPDR